MIIRDINSLKDTEREVNTPSWRSTRLLLKKDNMGFSLHETILHAGSEVSMCYKNHLEAVYCIEGFGDITDLSSGEIYKISPGVMYALDKNDPHVLHAKSNMRFVCVFNPPCVGNEVHDEEGAYPLLQESQ